MSIQVLPCRLAAPFPRVARAGLLACAIGALFALATPSIAAASDAAPGKTVESLLELAGAGNPDYAMARHEAAAADERIGPAGALPDPTLRVELMDITMEGAQSPTLSPNKVGSTQYQLMQEIPWFGKRGLRRDIATFEAQGAARQVNATWSELAARIKTDYAQLFYLNRNEQLTRELLDLTRRLEQIAQARYAGGLAAQQDVIRAQVEHTTLQNELIALESEQRQARARLNALVSRPPDATLAAPERLRPLPPPAALDYAALAERVRTRNPQLMGEAARTGAAEKTRELSYRNRYPDVALGIVPVQRGSGIKEWGLMIEVKIPIQQATRRSQEREANAMLAAARARKDAAANQLLAELSENLAGLDAARRTELEIANSLLPQAELSFKAALASYENAKVDFATLLDAQKQIRQAKQGQIKVQAEGQARLAQIERLLGEEL